LTGINTRSIVQSEQPLQQWIAKQNISVFYVDDLLRTLEPDLWNLIEKQLDKPESVMFSSETPYVRILRVDRNSETDTKSVDAPH